MNKNFEQLAGKKLAAIARRDNCDMKEAFARALDLYAAVQVECWAKGMVLGLLNPDLSVRGILHVKDIDNNFEIEL